MSIKPVAQADGTFNCDAPLGTLLYDLSAAQLATLEQAAPVVPDLKHKPTVQHLMDLARKFRATPGDLYDGAYKELQQACYEALAAAPKPDPEAALQKIADFGQLQALVEEQDALRAENERLREALRDVYVLIGQGGGAYDISNRTTPVIRAALAARAAQGEGK